MFNMIYKYVPSYGRNYVNEVINLVCTAACGLTKTQVVFDKAAITLDEKELMIVVSSSDCSEKYKDIEYTIQVDYSAVKDGVEVLAELIDEQVKEQNEWIDSLKEQGAKEAKQQKLTRLKEKDIHEVADTYYANSSLMRDLKRFCYEFINLANFPKGAFVVTIKIKGTMLRFSVCETSSSIPLRYEIPLMLYERGPEAALEYVRLKEAKN